MLMKLNSIRKIRYNNIKEELKYQKSHKGTQTKFKELYKRNK